MIDDAERFLATEKNAVGTQSVNGITTQSHVKLVARSRNINQNRPERGIYEIHLSSGSGPNIVPAYLLKYKSISLQGDNPEYVDIPKIATTKNFLFTGEFSGCSLIVTDKNASTYRVYHDSRPLSSVLHKNVVMAADLTDYIRGLEVNLDEILMTAYLQYDATRRQWKLLAQLLKEDSQPPHWRRIRGAQSELLPSFFSRWPNQYTVPPIRNMRREFQQEMEDLIPDINRSMMQIGVPWTPFPVPTAQDGPFTPFPNVNQAPIATNAAVNRTRTLRDTLQAMQNKLAELGQPGAYKLLIESIQGSKSVDAMHLWMLQKGL